MFEQVTIHGQAGPPAIRQIDGYLARTLSQQLPPIFNGEYRFDAISAIESASGVTDIDLTFTILNDHTPERAAGRIQGVLGDLHYDMANGNFYALFPDAQVEIVSTRPAPSTTAVAPEAVPVIMTADGTVTHGTLPPAPATTPPAAQPPAPVDPGHIEPATTIFGFSPLVLVGIAAGALFLFSSEK